MASEEQGLIVLRAGGDMQWVISALFETVKATLNTPDGPRTAAVQIGPTHQAVIHFAKLGKAAAADGSNIPPGFGTWVDRGMAANEPSAVRVRLELVGFTRAVRLPTPGAPSSTGFDKIDFPSTPQRLLFDHGDLFAFKVKRPAVQFLEVFRGTQTIHPWPPREATKAELTLRPSSFNFGPHAVGSGATVKLAMGNSGVEHFEVLSIGFVGAHPEDFDLLPSDCLPTGQPIDVGLGPGTSCELIVRFRPTAPGLRTSTLLIRHTAPLSPRKVPLAGDGIEDGTMSVAP